MKDKVLCILLFCALAVSASEPRVHIYNLDDQQTVAALSITGLDMKINEPAFMKITSTNG